MAQGYWLEDETCSRPIARSATRRRGCALRCVCRLRCVHRRRHPGGRADEIGGAVHLRAGGADGDRGFGGLYDASALKEMRHPVLVSSTDGVGTKVKLAAQAGRYHSIGQDIVNHCINDILVQGARPLFFLDYFATSKLQPEITAEVVAGIAEACREAGCALIGGETAEMPGVYSPGEFDVAGTIVGVVEKDAILPGRRYPPGRCADRPALLRPAHQRLLADPQDIRGRAARYGFPGTGHPPGRCAAGTAPFLSRAVEICAQRSRDPGSAINNRKSKPLPI